MLWVFTSASVIPDLSFIRPTIELPADILAGTTAPELVWQLPRAYALDKTLTPVTYEVQVRGVARPARSPHRVMEESKYSVEDDECVWRVLETNVKRTRLPLGRLDPEQEFWLRVVAVTDYGRGKPSQPVRKMVDLAARKSLSRVSIFAHLDDSSLSLLPQMVVYLPHNHPVSTNRSKLHT